MKSLTVQHQDQLKSPLGMYPDLQFSLLNEALELFQSIDFTGWEKKFLKGTVISINATIALQKQLRFFYKVLHFPVSRINQCHLERFFGEIRDMANDRNPSAAHILYRIQRLVIQKLIADPSFNPLDHKELFQLITENPQEFQTQFDEETLTSIIEELRKGPDMVSGLQSIASDVAKTSGHLSPSLCQGHLEI